MFQMPCSEGDKILQLAAERTNAILLIVQMVWEVREQLAMIIAFVMRRRIGADDDAITRFDQSIAVVVDEQLLPRECIPFKNRKLLVQRRPKHVQTQIAGEDGIINQIVKT